MTRKELKRRIYLIKAEVGCVACRQDGHYVTPCDAHHLISGSRRRGDRFTVPLCPWHHRGVDPRPGQELTPSLARNPEAFEAQYGPDGILLHLTDRALELLEENTVRGTS